MDQTVEPIDQPGPTLTPGAAKPADAGRPSPAVIAFSAKGMPGRYPCSACGTWQAAQETIDGGLVLPCGMLDTVTSLAAQAGSLCCAKTRHRR